ncbi:MAG: primosomal protein N' [Acidobacteria bacterium]|nr:primosomal protein N' [Acidobacteriota bacterium]
MSRYAEVALPIGARRLFSYMVPASLESRVLPGIQVLVPLGRRLLCGFVVRTSDRAPAGNFKLRAIQDLVEPCVPLPAELLETAVWTARRYFTPPGEVFRALLPAGSLSAGTRDVRLTRRAQRLIEGGLRPSGVNRDQQRILEVLAERGTLSVSKLASETGVRGASAHLEELSRSGLVELASRIEPPRVREKRQLAIRIRPAADRSSAALTRTQERLQAVLPADGGWKNLQAALREAGTSAHVARSLARLGTVEISPLTVDRQPPEISARPPEEIPTLTDGQNSVLRRLQSLMGERRAVRCLLHGVTGSGKTEVYLRFIADVVQQGGQAILLVPEIGLTPLLSRTVASRFPGQVALLHSALSPGERYDQWSGVRGGGLPVVVGTRSAVFAPLERLRLIVIDEEQDASYKQDETPHYHARDVAWRRIQAVGGMLLMGSATPSMETYYQAAEAGESMYLSLPERIEARPLAHVEIADMGIEFQKHGRKAIVSDLLRSGLAACLSRGEQAIVLLNRRGYSRTLLCRSCGHSFTCPACSISMTYHQEKRNLACHYCGREQEVPERCAECGGQYIYFLGVGTEQLEEILRTHLPGARIARVDRDSMRRRGSLRRVLTEFSEGKLDLLVGTQMIAKGHDFPRVTLVGVVGADADLGFPDFRSAERTFQLLTQVAGRSGRGALPGRVIIQAFYPEHYALRHARTQDYRGFYERETAFRKLMAYPPFTSLVQVVISHAESAKAFEIGQKVAAALKTEIAALSDDAKPRVLGPAAAPLERLKGKYRVQLLLKTPPGGDTIPLLESAFDALGRKKVALKYVDVDVDPLSLM